MPHCVRRSAGVFLIGLLLLAITAAAGPLFSQAQQFNARTEVVLVDFSPALVDPPAEHAPA
jgi:hypothetical protein